ncbi:hypothetical protein SAMN06269117_11322 [Balnearium lithotrophicum]|uniref:Uncharacterized protein n=1 Tax=Balnearium lithotrophicum TaxID=223788 RepID=A0A521CJ21_9BACT|nr:hypothetical protein [Balnearium lithotrophicum]SMO59463.1 hypothetical protein SAMN06269117_11322 [Balnearium lithotrophicum]
MTFEEVKDIVLSELGYPKVEVELTDEQINRCISFALSRINSDFVKKNKVALLLTPGQQSYPFPYEPFRVTYIPNPPEDIFSLFSEGNFLSIAYYARLKAWTEMAERAYGTDPDWEWEDGVLYLNPPPTSSSVCAVEYVTPYSLGEIEQGTEIGELFLLLVGAKARRILRTIRGKFSGVPSPGGTVQLDADVLLQEAQEAEEEYKRRVEERKFYGFFTTG